MTIATQSLNLPETGFVRLPQILHVIPIGRSTWWRWVKEGKAPKGKKLGPQTVVWNVQDIRQLLAEIDAIQED
jgi:prophage regulatory protein